MINYERYVNFYTDFAFKKLFGTEANKELLISFLNALLHGKEEIRDLTYLNTELWVVRNMTARLSLMCTVRQLTGPRFW